MAINTANARAYGDVLQRVYTSLPGTTAPTLPAPAALSAGWYDLGWLDDSGLVESPNQHQETKKFGWQGAGLIRVLRSQFENPFTFHCVEENAVTMGLMRPGKTVVSTGFTAEVQTITITGTPAGGTWTFSHPASGVLSGIVYNVSTAALATLLTNAIGGTVTVTGTAGTSYVVTFPSSLGNTTQAQVSQAFTGGSSPAISIATTTPGVNGTNNQPVGPTPALNLRQFVVDLIDGSIHKRLWFPNAEVIVQGTVSYKADDLTIYEATLNPYVDASGNFYYDINDNPAVGSGLYA